MQLTIEQALQLAHQHHASARVDVAENIFRHILAADPQRPEALYRLGLILLDRNDSSGIDLVRRALVCRPDYAEAHLCLGNILEKQNRLDEAIACYRRAILFKPDYADAYNNLAAMLQCKDRADEAINAYRQALSLQPDYFDAAANLSNLLQNQNRPREAIPLARKAVELRPEFAPAHAHLAGALRLGGVLGEAADECALAIKLDPRCAIAHHILGDVHMAAERYEEALQSYQAAMSLVPDSADSMVNHAIALHRLGRDEEAVPFMQRALQLQPNFSLAHYHFGSVLEALDRIPEALAEYRTAAALKPNDYQHQNDLGMSLMILGLYDQAEVALKAATLLDPARTESRFNLSLCQLLTGNFNEGWKNYEVRWCQPKFVKQKCNINKPQWNGRPPQPGTGNTLLICPEQGFGDMIQFVRFTPRAIAMGWKVILEVQRDLRPLFEIARPRLADEFITWPESAGQDFPSVDSVIHVASIPMALEIDPTSADFDFTPYLQAEPYLRAIWRERLGEPDGRRRVGLVWGGGVHHPMDKQRSMPLSMLAPLCRADVKFFSLQMGPPAEQLKDPPPGMEIVELSPWIKSFNDTAAILAELDLLITIDSSPAHLAGAMGRPCWVMITQVPDFRWLLDRNHSPWYPSVRLYRQSRRNQWGTVVEQVAADLAKFAIEQSDR